MRYPLGVRWGNPTSNSVTMVVASMSNAAATVDCAGTSHALTWNAVGTDYPGGTPAQACYVAHVTLTGLTAFPADNPYTVTQGADTIAGRVLALPDKNQDCALWFGTCDNIDTGYTGYWQLIAEYAQAGNTPKGFGIFFVDDTIYTDQHFIDDSAGTGLAMTDKVLNSGLAFDFAVMYMAQQGLIDTTAVMDPGLPNGDWALGTYGVDPYRRWCYQNLAFLPQWGDHEFRDNFGQGSNGHDPTTEPTYYATAKSVYDAFTSPLQGPSIQNVSGVGDTSANHWALDVGCATLVAPDNITNGQHGVAAFGSAQIDDLLTALNTTQPFKLLGWPRQFRNVTDRTVGGQAGAAWPVDTNYPAEYSQLFTASGNAIKSVMDNPWTNGVLGATITPTGDYHHAMVIRLHKPASGSDLAESWYAPYLGTINGSINFALLTASDQHPGVGYTYNDITLEYDSEWDFAGAGGAHPDYWAGMRFDLYGSSMPKEMHCYLMDEADTVQWSKKWVQYHTDNLGAEIDADLGISGGSSFGVPDLG